MNMEARQTIKSEQGGERISAFKPKEYVFVNVPGLGRKFAKVVDTPPGEPVLIEWSENGKTPFSQMSVEENLLEKVTSERLVEKINSRDVVSVPDGTGGRKTFTISGRGLIDNDVFFLTWREAAC